MDLEMPGPGIFFGKLLAITFAIGVATGIVMEFQFGTNWATYSRFVGDIFGAPLAAEGVFAFFLDRGPGLLFSGARISSFTLVRPLMVPSERSCRPSIPG
jgi:hypothetical protein